MPDDVRREAIPAAWNELAEESVVTPSDVTRARRFWGYWGTRLFRAMLRARENEK